jgi:hypothetical protein
MAREERTPGRNDDLLEGMNREVVSFATREDTEHPKITCILGWARAETDV